MGDAQGEPNERNRPPAAGRGTAPLRAGLIAWEQRLRRAASRRRVGCHDPELARVLAKIEARRAARGPDCAMSHAPAPGAEPAGASSPGASAASSPVESAAGSSSTPSADGPAVPGTVVAATEVAPGIRILRIEPPRDFSWRAGQHVRIGVTGVDTQRRYSIASAPHERHLELCVELVPGGRLTPALFALGPGARVEVSARAKGSFTLAERARTHLMVATVTGIAPLRSMLRDALHRGATSTFFVLHGASYADELPYREELEALARAAVNVRYVPTVSRPAEPRNAGWQGRTGRAESLVPEAAAEIGASAGVQVYACGHSGMIATVREQLRARGLPVATEAFD